MFFQVLILFGNIILHRTLGQLYLRQSIWAAVSLWFMIMMAIFMRQDMYPSNMFSINTPSLPTHGRKCHLLLIVLVQEMAVPWPMTIMAIFTRLEEALILKLSTNTPYLPISPPHSLPSPSTTPTILLLKLLLHLHTTPPIRAMCWRRSNGLPPLPPTPE